MRSLFLTVIMCCIILCSSAQSFSWWANVVHWDGVTPWERYTQFFPGFLGPNALPVPPISNGSIDSVNTVGLSGDFYFSKDDHTQNISFYGNYCLVKNKISMDVVWMPIEHFTMSHHLKEERHVFSDHYYDHYGKGDVYLNTKIRLVNNEAKKIQFAVRIGYRFPTSEIGAARFTDAPGYYLDISFAKGFHALPGLKWIAMAGGYFWQADNVASRNRQDDAFLFGSGLEWNKKNLRIQTYITGYLGYLEEKRDKPIVFRAGFDKTIKRIILFFQFQQGLHNFNYSSVVLGMKYRYLK